jgi:flagellin
MRINTNVMAFNAQRNLGMSNVAMGKSLEKLSSGFRINRAGDDAAGLVISQKLRAEIGGLRIATRNAQDGISFVQTAEGALANVHDILGRIRDLTVQAASDTNDATARAALEAEVTALRTEITRIGSDTKFAGGDVFGAAKAIQVGANGVGDQITIDSITAPALNAPVGGLVSAATARTYLGVIDTAIANVSASRGSLGAIQNRLESTIKSLQVTTENLQASESRIRDTDMAAEMVDFTKFQILQQAGTAMLGQANALPQSILSLLR